MFNGDYKFVKAEVVEDKVLVTTLTAKEAADPNTSAGVLITFANGIDRLIVIGEDVYKLIHETVDMKTGMSSRHGELTVTIAWNAKKIPKEQGDAIIEMLNMSER